MPNIYSSLFSLLFLIGALYFHRKANSGILNRWLFFVLSVSSVVFFVAYGAADYFTGTGIDDATFYHLKYGLTGAGFFEYSYLIAVSTGVLLAGFVGLVWLVLPASPGSRFSRKKSLFSFSLVLTSLILNPASIDIYNLQKSYHIYGDEVATAIPADFNNYYNKPYLSKTGNQTKNIVFIFAESLERSYFDENFFPGLIKGIRGLESKSTYFTNIRQAASTGWTVGGITAGLCGIPLFTPSGANSMAGMDQFLSSAVCLGDLLSDEGYHLAFMGGADLNFAGKGKLFQSHGFTDVQGKDELLPQIADQSYLTFWGLHDDSLFKLMYERFLKLSEDNERFGLFTLTLNTHHPNGHISNDCEGLKYSDGSNPILNAVTCSDFLITEFINKILDSPYADQTVIVLASDHFSMRNTAYPYLLQTDRRNLFMIIEPGSEKSVQVKTSGSTLDISTTLLPFIGYSGEIGLGRNLMDDSGKTQDDIHFIQNNIMRWIAPLSSFWSFPTIEDSLGINVGKQQIRIDHRIFKFPIFVELDSNLDTKLKFQRQGVKGEHSLITYRNKLGSRQYFLLIDECENVKQLDSMVTGDGFCLLAGQGKKYSEIRQLDEDLSYSISEIRELLNIQ